MPRGSSPKRERQYEHIKASAKQRGENTKQAEEIAARTVNKERARSGEARTPAVHQPATCPRPGAAGCGRTGARKGQRTPSSTPRHAAAASRAARP